MMNEVEMIGTTDAEGAATIYSDLAVLGRLYAIEWIDGTLADGVDAVLSNNGADFDTTLFTFTDANSDARYYPRDLVHDAAGSALTGTSGGDRAMPLINGRLKLVIASGGAAATGGCRVYFLD